MTEHVDGMEDEAVSKQEAGNRQGSGSEPNEKTVTAPLSWDRLIALRRWIAAGFYDDPKVVARTAARILERNDL